MNGDDIDDLTRRAIGGDAQARSRLATLARSGDHLLAQVVVSVLEADPSGLDRAAVVATARRDREVVEIARAHLSGDRDRVDALARDHLADHPGSLIVAWIAAGAAGVGTPPRRG